MLSDLCDIVFGILVREVGQQSGNNGIQISTKEFKVSLFADHGIVHISDSQTRSKVRIMLINSISGVAWVKTNSKQSTSLLYTNGKWEEKEIR